MAAKTSQRVAAFLLAFMFLLTTVGAAVYVIIELNKGEGGLVVDTANTPTTQTNEQAEAPVQEDSTTLADFTGPVEVPELRFDDTVEGTGEVVLEGQTVTIHYTGALASDGTVFDSSVGGEPATFPLDNLIQGWQEGIPGMKIGGTRRLFIPSALGYGAAGSGSAIPANADLVFDIELFAAE